MTSPTTEPRAPLTVELRPSDGALLVGSVVYAEGPKAATTRAMAVLAGRPGIFTPHDREVAQRVLNFFSAAQSISTLAAQAGPPVTGPVPSPPQRPAIRLRTEVEVDGLPAVDLGVYVHPSPIDTAHAVTSAARALHDAALAALHVLVVEPADPAGGAP